MCSSTTNLAQQSTTWAASVPMDDLAQAIKAAVGVQPVRQVPPPALLKLAEQQQEQQQRQQQECSCPAATTASCSPSQQAIAGCGLLDCTASQPPLPMRRPTLAEVRAASPADDAIAADLCRTDSNSSAASSVSDIDSACAQLLLSQQQQQQWQQAAEPTSPAYFDDMDDVQQQLPDCFHTYDSSPLPSDQDSSDTYLQVSSSMRAAWDNVSSEQLQQQKELLCKIWSELQLPTNEEQQPQLSCDTGRLVDVAAECIQQPGSSTSSCSSSLGATREDSSCYCSSCCGSSAAAAACDDMTESASCSSSNSSGGIKHSKQRRVSWGSVTEYQLPPEDDWGSVWVAWVQAKLMHVSRRDACAVIVAGLCVAATGTAGYMLTRRLRA